MPIRSPFDRPNVTLQVEAQRAIVGWIGEHLRIRLAHILSEPLPAKIGKLATTLERENEQEGSENLAPSATTVERAFMLAGSGECGSIDAIVRRLDREGYDGRQIQGPVLRQQLRDLIKRAK